MNEQDQRTQEQLPLFSEVNGDLSNCGASTLQAQTPGIHLVYSRTDIPAKDQIAAIFRLISRVQRF